MKIVVKFLGVLKESAGKDQTVLELPGGATAGDAYQTARQFLPKDRRYPKVLLAINHEFAKTGARLKDGDEVALIPPMSGG